MQYDNFQRALDHGFVAMVLLLVSSATLLTASPGASLSLGRLLGQSDAVIVGTITGAVRSGTDVAISVDVVRVPKGPIVPGTSVQLTWSAANSMDQHPDPGNYLNGRTELWFLKQNGAGWDVLPVSAGGLLGVNVSIALPPGARPGLYDSAGKSTAGRLARDLAIAAEDPKTSIALAYIFMSGAADDLDPAVLSQLWAETAASPLALTRAIGLSGQIRTGQPAALAVVTGLDPAEIASHEKALLSNAVCAYRNGDNGGIDSLGKLADARYAQSLQPCAAHALRSIHTRGTIQYLRRMLDSDSPQIQYEGVAGLASFANGLPVQTAANTVSMEFLKTAPNAPFASGETEKNFPAIDTFHENPQAYIQFWKSWLTANRLE